MIIFHDFTKNTDNWGSILVGHCIWLLEHFLFKVNNEDISKILMDFVLVFLRFGYFHSENCVKSLLPWHKFPLILWPLFISQWTKFRNMHYVNYTRILANTNKKQGSKYVTWWRVWRQRFTGNSQCHCIRFDRIRVFSDPNFLV